MESSAQNYLYIPLLQRRNTDLKTRITHLIKKAYLVPADQKARLLTITEEFFTKHFSDMPAPLLNLLLFWEILKHLQHKHSTIYSEQIIPKITPILPDLHYKILYTPTDIFPSTFTNTSKTTLYTFTPEQISNLGTQLFLAHLSIHMAKIIEFYYSLQPLPLRLPLYLLDNFLIYRLYWESNLSHEPTRIKLLLPAHYYNILKRFFIDKHTMLALSRFISSKKRAKKYLRILHKRLGIYAKRKPPWRTKP